MRHPLTTTKKKKSQTNAKPIGARADAAENWGRQRIIFHSISAPGTAVLSLAIVSCGPESPEIDFLSTVACRPTAFQVASGFVSHNLRSKLVNIVLVNNGNTGEFRCLIDITLRVFFFSVCADSEDPDPERGCCAVRAAPLIMLQFGVVFRRCDHAAPARKRISA